MAATNSPQTIYGAQVVPFATDGTLCNNHSGDSCMVSVMEGPSKSFMLIKGKIVISFS